ncbi:MAG: response regulator transcription factor [Brasilonema angustatum HA4187-MV1]|jgi:DNA-binding response OmpR family regulator|nr:response regulator transcription factor [Brasilonema angustatum HA4187-MV1]
MAVVLVIEDEVNVAAMIRLCVESEGHICDIAYNGNEGLDKFSKLQPDVVILDLMLPGRNGLDICAHIRQFIKSKQKDPYIMMLTSKIEEIDRIIGFSTGADDYMPKPFSPVELAVRLRALLRREQRQQVNSENMIETRHLLIDQERRTVHLKDTNGTTETIKFTTLEFNLLVVLASRPGRVWSRSQLLDTVWGMDYVGDIRIVDSYVKRLRQKLCSTNATGEKLDKTQFICTVPGIGYSFTDSNGKV